MLARAFAKKQALDARIAAALSANGEADRDSLADLIREAADAIDKAREIIEVKKPRIHDLANDDPDKSIQLVASNEVRITRMTAAISRLEARVAAIDLEAEQTAWSEQARALQDEADDLYFELQQTYPGIVKQLDELFRKARANAGAFYQLLEVAPSGVDHTFHPAEPWENFWLIVALPDWHDSRVTHPPRTKPADPKAEIALSSAAFAKQLDAKMAIGSGPNWWAAKQLSDDQARTEIEKREAEMKEKAEQERQEYYRALLEAERRRAIGNV
jgi:hypothetical protein